MGGIYILGIQPLTRIYNNLIYQVNCRFYGGEGIYTDEGSAQIVIEKNICYDCRNEGLVQHYGAETVYRYNISAFCRENGVHIGGGRNCRRDGFAAEGPVYSKEAMFIKNVVIVDNRPFFTSAAYRRPEPLSFEQYLSECNYFWDVSGNYSVIAYVNKDIQYNKNDWQAMGHDQSSVFGDPGFVDPQNRDFHLKADSPLRKWGFPDPADTLDHAGPVKKTR